MHASKMPKQKKQKPEEPLKSWASIAKFLSQPVSTVQRWANEGMPLTGIGRYVAASPHEAENTKTGTPRLWLPVLIFLATLASPSQVTRSTAEVESPDLNLILQRLEDIQHQDPALSRPYEVTREYKVFHGL